MRRAPRLAASLLAVTFSGIARAQGAPQMQLQAEASTVGVGDVVHVQLDATSAGTMPSDPQLAGTQAFVVRGQSSAPQTQISIVNGARTDRYTLSTSWALEAKRVGRFQVGPASAAVGGSRFPSKAIEITVVPAGQAPRPRRPQSPFPPGFQSPFSFSPFDPWKGFFQGFDNDNTQQAPATEVATDPKLALDVPRGPYYFLHATVDKQTAVVGEQVTFSVYEYVDIAARADIDAEDAHDPTVVDFAKRQLLREDQEPPVVGYASVAGGTWRVRLARRWALFPLRAGDLTIGPMRIGLTRPQAAAGTQRASETIVVHASEPPVAGRPPGYAIGDVGRFILTAQVSPREVEEGGAIAVHVELAGTGNLPGTLGTPARQGIEWLTPEIHDEVGPTGRDAFGGKRTFDYVVRPRRHGDVDLGDLTLPFWNPEQRKYEVARASLGSVRVTQSAAASDAPAEPLKEMLPGLPAARDALAGNSIARAHLDDSPIYWIAGIGAWPAAFAVAVGGRAVGKRVVGAWRRRKASPATELKERLAAATSACSGADARNADAAIARALEAAAVAHAGVSVRGALGTEVVDRLEKAGIGREAASRVADLLRECEAARFAPEAADITTARNRWQRAQGAIRGLERDG